MKPGSLEFLTFRGPRVAARTPMLYDSTTSIR
jgi:hypothetical protein